MNDCTGGVLKKHVNYLEREMEAVIPRKLNAVYFTPKRDLPKTKTLAFRVDEECHKNLNGISQHFKLPIHELVRQMIDFARANMIESDIK